MRGWLALTVFLATPAWAQTVPQTEVQMLSGHGSRDAMPWRFRIDSGRGAGRDTVIAVPSNWQQQGFGAYQYGYDKGPRVAGRATYRRSFVVPKQWAGRSVDIVFDGVMTDAQVTVNGVAAGPVHQGGFNRFRYDITQLVKVGGSNDLVVEVAEASAALDTDIAERHGDYWVFGGIYRPVWLESVPAQAIDHVAIDAQASGAWSADVTLRAPRTVTRVAGQIIDRDGRPVGSPVTTAVPGGGAGQVRLSGVLAAPLLWSAETPNLYRLQVTLFAGETPVHATEQRFGFRTFVVRADGLYLNGQRIMLKGVNRHSFRPETGRVIGRDEAYADVRLIRSLNMNAVRMSHYAPEKEFLEAADELGLYVLDELSGWQHAHDTEVGRKLVRELIERDVNHPSILFWANGNEGGWNRALDPDFALYDPQHRTVLHPWEAFGGIDTKHYPRYPDLLKRLAGPIPVMPTEFLHGLFDGGGGAGLDDYWRAMSASPRGAGGFLWNLADEGVTRTDRGGRVDTYATYAPDGIVGPHDEWEPSAYTVRDIWSPVQIAPPVRVTPGAPTALTVRNLYDFTTLDAVRFRWEWIAFAAPDAASTAPRVLASGTMAGPPVAPHGEAAMTLPAPVGAGKADALRLTAMKSDQTLLSWVWPTSAPRAVRTQARLGTPTVDNAGATIVLRAGPVAARFDRASGMLRSLAHGARSVDLGEGPQLVLARPEDDAADAWSELSDTGSGIYRLPHAMLADRAEIDLGRNETDGWGAFRLEVSGDDRTWRTVYDGARVARDGQDYSFPAQPVVAVRISQLSGVRSKPRVRSVRIAGNPDRYRPPDGKSPSVETGSGTDPATRRRIAWLAASQAGGIDAVRWILHDDGTLTLDYDYALTGSVLYHGIGMEMPQIGPARALMRGPQPVWQNRLRGPLLGVYEVALPGRAGYLADPRWVRLQTAAGALTIVSDGPSFLQLGARLADFPTTSVAFPATNLGFLHAIPAMGAKMQAAPLTGPAGQPAMAAGHYRGRLSFTIAGQ